MSTQPAQQLAPSEHADLEPLELLSRSFKQAMASVRRLRGRETHRPGGLGDAQFGLMFGLRAHAELSSRELAHAADVSPAAASEMLDGLVAAGLVRRERSERDRRVVLVSLTERGRALVEEHWARFEPRWRAAFADFSNRELIAAVAVLERMRSLFDEIADERTDGSLDPHRDQPVD